jgi:hypothetical protein
MPFKSEAQRRYLWSQHPEIAARWQREYGSKVQSQIPDGKEYTVAIPPQFLKNKKNDPKADAKKKAAAKKLQMLKDKQKGK